MADLIWSPSSWKTRPVAQIVNYPDQQHLGRVLSKINTLPPLVTPAEVGASRAFASPRSCFLQIERLRFQLAAVQRNEAFLLHAGDCAESFDACTQQNISAKIGLILSFSLILIWGGRLPVVRIGRIAGQYAKPRSSGTERIGGREVPSFRPSRRGDNVNGLDPNDRTPDPERLLSAYFHSTATLNYVRGLLTSGFASLHHPRDWSLSHVRSPSLRSEFEKITQGLSDALDFSHTIGANSGRENMPFERGGGRGVLGEVDFYTRSAPLLLVGPSLGNDELINLLEIVNPNKESGRVTLITRYGAGKIGDHLAGHIEAVKRSGHPVAWVCDPMHGNTLTSGGGLKTRNFGTIISELTSCISIHAACGSRLGGVSLEFTGELNDEGFSVTECLGGSMELSEEQLGLRYQSFCDPRLNFEQSLDVAFLISNHFKEERLGGKGENGIFAALGGGRQSNSNTTDRSL
ncbi:hypothetical protein AZE42_05523 [Rhizopogon vesiculosus]|uniref:Phospho-2-dehydro-3-deoxyheptonate aldolase n=1 Tax=Rhizopogon vesiculosus TaxID=180088 RepID=A0A1J8QJB7_9AGAM|nr:hypothetical protein AZE42_05523 [Rhizopogon vesiculosus]